MTGLHDPLLCKDFVMRQPWASAVGSNDGRHTVMGGLSAIVLSLTVEVQREQRASGLK
jgi:hypothetical protein